MSLAFGGLTMMLTDYNIFADLPELSGIQLAFDESKVKRDAGKFSTHQGAGAKNNGVQGESDHPSEFGDEHSEQAGILGYAKDLLGHAAEFPKDVLRSAWERVTTKYKEFESRYGRKTAIGIIGLLIVPGSFVTVPVGIALAETYLRLTKTAEMSAIDWETEPAYLAFDEMAHYSHVEGGVCFECDGLGYVEKKDTESKPAWLAHDHSHKTNEEPAVDRLIKEASRWYTKVTAKFRAELKAALKQPPGPRQQEAIRNILHAHAPAFARALTNARIASIVGGMQEVTKVMPPVEELPESRRQHLDTVTAQMKSFGPADQDRWLQSISPEERIYAAGLLGRAETEEPPKVPALPSIGGEPEEPIRLPLLEEATANLLARRLMTRAEFDAIAQRERQNAFTVAGLETTAAIAKVQQAAASATVEGKDLDEFIDAAGAESFLSPAHAETVFRTNLSTGFTSGIERLLDHPLVGDLFPYMATDDIKDDRTTEYCEKMAVSGIQGTNIYRRDDPIWEELGRTPRHYNCRGGVTPMTVRKAAERGIKTAQRWRETGQPVPPEEDFVLRPAVAGLEGYDPRFRSAA